MARAKLGLRREKVQVVLQLEDPAQEYAWGELEKLRMQNKLQSFLRNVITEALPRPATAKLQTVRPTAATVPDLRYVKGEDEA